MKFDLVDEVLERSDDRIVVLKQVSRAEEYLADHFPGFPVLPGVMMIETLVQAARHLLDDRVDGILVLGEVKALKFGSMVRPGQALRVEVSVTGEQPDGSFACRGAGQLIGWPDEAARTASLKETAVSGRFTMRGLRPAGPA